MTRRALAITALLITATTAACSDPAPAPDTSAVRDAAAIDALRAAYASAANANDAIGLSGFYTDDAVRAESNRPPLVGRDAIAAAERDMMTAFDRIIARRSLEMNIAGDWAFDRGEYLIQMKARKIGDELLTDEGHYLSILRRQADGAWKIAREVTSSNEAPRPPAPAPARGAR